MLTGNGVSRVRRGAQEEYITERRGKRLRVLHVVSSLDAKDGGTTAVVHGLAIAQARSGLTVTALATFRKDFDPTTVDSLREAGIYVSLVGPARGALVRHPELQATVRSMVAECDIVHIHALWEEIQHQAAVVARQLDVPYIVTPHGMLDPWSLSRSRWKKRLYMLWRLRRDLNCATALHFTSRIEKERVLPLKISSPGIVLPNGINLEEYQDLPDRGEFRARYKLSDDVPLVLFLGRLHPKKGCDLLIEGFSRAFYEQVDPEKTRPLLVFVGPDDGGYQTQLESLAHEFGISNSVLFAGPLYGKDKLAAFVDADLFGLISHQENFGIAVIEALATGCPVLVSDQVNIHELIENEQVGWVVPTDCESVAQALSKWFFLRNNIDDMRRRARVVATGFDWDGIAKSWIEQYQNMVTSKAPSSGSRLDHKQ